jgi:hypothetical protein
VIELDVRGGLLAAVADEPPLRTDPDELVATARRQVRRRALVATGLATVLVAVAAVAVPAALDPATAIPAATRQAAPSTGVATTPYSMADLRERAGELRKHLQRVLPEALPAASKVLVGAFGGEAEGDFYAGQTSINAAVTFSVDGARYSIMVTTWVPGTAASPARTCGVHCHRLADQAGGAVYLRTDDLGKAVVETAYHYRDTGSLVSVAAYNYDMTSAVPAVYHPALPVTRAQLVAIATDQELAL